MDAFYDPDGPLLHASALTRGPWDDRFQHGGPPSALLARALSRFDGVEDFALARIQLTFLRAVPIGTMRVRARLEHGGRASQRLSAVLEVDGVEVLTALALRIRRAPIAPSLPDEPAWPDPEGLEPFAFPFFRNEIGYHRAIDLRVAGGTWGATPVRFWARPRVPLVAGEATEALEDVVILADAQSGMGIPIDVARYTFVNPDLMVAFGREPAKGWVGLDIRSMAGEGGAGLAQSLLYDARGLFGGCSQSLIVAPRPPA